MKTLCLVMIIRSDAHGLGNCLESVKGLVDRWIVCGSGTARDTRQTIEQAMDGIPGDFHDLEWVNFGANRTRAMELAAGKADYHLVLDANMVVRYKREFRHELEERTPIWYRKRGQQTAGLNVFLATGNNGGMWGRCARFLFLPRPAGEPGCQASGSPAKKTSPAASIDFRAKLSC